MSKGDSPPPPPPPPGVSIRVGGAVCVPRAGARVVITGRSGDDGGDALAALAWASLEGVLATVTPVITGAGAVPDSIRFDVQVGDNVQAVVIPLAVLDTYVRIRT